jgi:hypothetical protein
VSTTTDRHYLHRLGYHLQSRGLPEHRIEEVLAEARAHVAHSGESLREAFGAPREYARRWDAAPGPRRWAQPLVSGAARALGGGALLVGAVWLAAPHAPRAWPVLLMVLGTAVLVGAAAVVPVRTLWDPVSACRRGSRRTAVLTTLASCLIVVAAGFVGAVV